MIVSGGVICRIACFNITLKTSIRCALKNEFFRWLAGRRWYFMYLCTIAVGLQNCWWLFSNSTCWYLLCQILLKWLELWWQLHFYSSWGSSFRILWSITGLFNCGTNFITPWGYLIRVNCSRTGILANF